MTDYVEDLLADRPLGYWPAWAPQAGTTTVRDLSGNGKHGAWNTVPSIILDSPVDVEPACLRMANTTNWTIADDALWDQASEWSVECWFRCSVTATQQGLVARDPGSGSTNRYYQIRKNTDNLIHAFVFNNGDAAAGTTELVSDSAVTDNRWHHLLLAVSTAGAELWIDGVLNDSATFSYTFPAGTRQIDVGVRGGAYAGDLCHLAFHGRRLTGGHARTRYWHRRL